jgi:hypothetical protein
MAIKTFTDNTSLPASDINTFLANSGLVYITTTTFSGAATTNTDGCFSATYDSYRIICNYTGSAITDTRLILRNGSGNITGSFYRFQAIRAYGSSTDGLPYYNTAFVPYFGLAYGASSAMAQCTHDIFNPFATQITTATFTCFADTSGPSVNYMQAGGWQYAQTTSATGFQLAPASGNITGTVTVYGYRKA